MDPFRKQMRKAVRILNDAGVTQIKSELVGKSGHTLRVSFPHPETKEIKSVYLMRSATGLRSERNVLADVKRAVRRSETHHAH